MANGWLSPRCPIVSEIVKLPQEIILKVDTLIYDMDVVITTEEKSWACARLTLWELVTHTLDLPTAFGDAVSNEVAREAVCSDDLIYALKSRAVNSNWDITYVLVCVYIAALPGVSVQYASDVDSLLQAVRATRHRAANWPTVLELFLSSTSGIEGRALIEEAGERVQTAN